MSKLQNQMHFTCSDAKIIHVVRVNGIKDCFFAKQFVYINIQPLENILASNIRLKCYKMIVESMKCITGRLKIQHFACNT